MTVQPDDEPLEDFEPLPYEDVSRDDEDTDDA